MKQLVDSKEKKESNEDKSGNNEDKPKDHVHSRHYSIENS